jgi:hypothetical protein
MVPSLALTIAADGKRLSCGGFFLGESIHFGSLEFITDRFGGLSLSRLGDGSCVIIMGPAHGGPPLQSWTMVGLPPRGFLWAPDGEGRTDLPSPRRHGIEAPPT